MNTEMIIKRIPVSELKPSKYNPRKDLKPGNPAYEKIRAQSRRFGYAILAAYADSHKQMCEKLLT